jgi:hypothetical protein
MTVRRLRIACWIPKAINTHSQYVVLFADPLEQWLRERASVLRYVYIACLVEVVRMVRTESTVHFFIILRSTHDSCDREGFLNS